MNHFAPSIAKLAGTLRADIEKAVCAFPRTHRYVCGAELRRAITTVSVLVDRAWRDKPRSEQWVQELSWAMDEFRLSLQLCKDVQAFASFAQFEQLARDMAELGCQVGGWYKQKHPQGQNVGAGSPPQRAKTLSTRSASQREANP